MKTYPKSGRPTICTPEFIQKAWDYVNGEWETVHEHPFPSAVGLFLSLNIGKTTGYRWASIEDHEFREILEDLNSRQEVVLFDRSLKGDYNAAIAKLALGKQGYSDKQELTGNEGGPIEVVWTIDVVEPEPKP